jgi:hypothetical protein
MRLPGASLGIAAYGSWTRISAVDWCCCFGSRAFTHPHARPEFPRRACALGDFRGRIHHFRGADGRAAALFVACVARHTALLAPCIASRLHHANGKFFSGNRLTTHRKMIASGKRKFPFIFAHTDIYFAYHICEVKMRALVDIPDRQIDDLTVICETKKLSRAEAIRQAIAYYIERNKPGAVDAFGLWKNRKVDGMAYQEQVRSEW